MLVVSPGASRLMVILRARQENRTTLSKHYLMAALGRFAHMLVTGVEGYGDDRGPAAKAKIDTFGVALDHAGNLYIAESALVPSKAW